MLCGIFKPLENFKNKKKISIFRRISKDIEDDQRSQWLKGRLSAVTKLQSLYLSFPRMFSVHLFPSAFICSRLSASFSLILRNDPSLCHESVCSATHVCFFLRVSARYCLRAVPQVQNVRNVRSDAIDRDLPCVSVAAGPYGGLLPSVIKSERHASHSLI